MRRGTRPWNIFWLVMLMTGSATSASACQPGSGSSYYPVCAIPAANIEDEVIVVNGERAPSRHSSVAVKDGRSVSIVVVDLEIKPSQRPLYIVLTSYDPVIWRFKGATTAVSRVVALGSTTKGAELVGVTGIPREKVAFPVPDKDVLAEGNLIGGKYSLSMCDWMGKACNPSHYHFKFPSPGAERTAVVKTKFRTPLHLPQNHYYRPQAYSVAPDGLVPKGSFDEPRRVDYFTNDPASPVSVMRPPPVSLPDEAVVLRPEDIASPSDVFQYTVLPGAAGLRQLMEKGTLHTQGSTQFDDAYRRWNEARSAPYRSQFDPGFVFKDEHISHLLTAPDSNLPAGVLGRFLLAEGVTIPQHSIDPHRQICFFYVNGARAGDEDCDPTFRYQSARVSGANGDSIEIQKARLDDIRWLESASTEELSRVRSSPVTSFELRDVVTSRRKYLRPEEQSCRMFQFANDVHSVALTIYSGRTEPKSETAKAQFAGGRGGRIDVEVRRPGRSLLYLNSEVGAQWHVKAAPGSEIAGILLRDRGAVVEAPAGTEIKNISGLYAYARPSSPDCGAYWPPAKGQLGGPAPILIDKALVAMTGKGLDRYVARKMPRDISRNVSESDWLRSTDIRDFTTFIVD